MPTGVYPRTPLIERFNNGWTPEPFSGCWLWFTSWGSNGYGLIGARYAHRVSWILHYGEIPKGLCVLHRCDVPCCVNPKHLFLGTKADNSQDMVSKGRDGATRHPDSLMRGERHCRAKLTESQIAEIRQRYSFRKVTCKQLAIEFGVSKSAIRFVVRGLSWKHV